MGEKSPYFFSAYKAEDQPVKYAKLSESKVVSFWNLFPRWFNKQELESLKIVLIFFFLWIVN